MDVRERSTRLSGLDVYQGVRATVDDRTLEILEQRRRTAVVKGRGWLMRRMLLASDIAGLVLAFGLAEWSYGTTTHVGRFSVEVEVLLFSASLPVWVVMAKLYGLYDRDEERADHSTADDVLGVLHLVTVGTWLFFAFAYITGFAHPYLPKLLVFWLLAVLGIPLLRSIARTRCRRSIHYVQNTLIVGAGDVGQDVARKLLKHPEYGINVVGFVDSEPKEFQEDLGHLVLLGERRDVPALVRILDIERVIVAFANEPYEQSLELIRSLDDLDVRIDVVPRLFEALGPNVSVHMVEGMPLIGIPPLDLSRSSAFLKRGFDIAASAAGITLLAPLLIVVAMLVKIDSRGSIIYRHERVGRGKKPIDVFKFRTMYREACRGERYGGAAAEAAFRELMSDPNRALEFEETYKLTHDPRVTRIGSILRRTSLDELPQLLNVLRGDLSLIGPRAVTAQELSRYGERVDDLLRIRPGVTGYWQVNGRSQLSYEDRVRLDLSYVRGRSLGVDLMILAKTLRVVFARSGAL